MGMLSSQLSLLAKETSAKLRLFVSRAPVDSTQRIIHTFPGARQPVQRKFITFSEVSKGFLTIALFFVVAGVVFGGVKEVGAIACPGTAPELGYQIGDPNCPKSEELLSVPKLTPIDSTTILKSPEPQSFKDQVNSATRGFEQGVSSFEAQASGAKGDYCAQSAQGGNGVIPACDLSQCNYTLDAFLLLAINIIKYILGITGSLALAMFVLGGVQWFLSRGASGEVEKGLNTMVNAVIGLAIIFGSWTAVNFIMSSVAKAGQDPFMVKLTQGAANWAKISAVTCIPFTSVELSSNDSFAFKESQRQNAISNASTSASAFVPGGPQVATKVNDKPDCEKFCAVKANGAILAGTKDNISNYDDVTKMCTCNDYVNLSEYKPSDSACGAELTTGTQKFYGVVCDRAEMHGITTRWQKWADGYRVALASSKSDLDTMQHCVRLERGTGNPDAQKFEENTNNVNDKRDWSPGTPQCEFTGWCYSGTQHSVNGKGGIHYTTQEPTTTSLTSMINSPTAAPNQRTLLSRCQEKRNANSTVLTEYFFCRDSFDPNNSLAQNFCIHLDKK